MTKQFLALKSNHSKAQWCLSLGRANALMEGISQIGNRPLSLATEKTLFHSPVESSPILPEPGSLPAVSVPSPPPPWVLPADPPRA